MYLKFKFFLFCYSFYLVFQRNNIFNLLYQYEKINEIQFQKYTCYYVSKIKKINIFKINGAHLEPPL
jgi:hypothetical protein